MKYDFTDDKRLDTPADKRKNLKAIPQRRKVTARLKA